VTVAVLVLAAPTFAQDTLAGRLEAVMDGPDYAAARWGVLIADAKTGEPVYARNADKLFTPASTTKLYTCAAALVALGADHTFTTRVVRRGAVGLSGTLKGDLILVASGDPSFGGRTTRDGKLAFKDKDHTYANSGLMESELTDTDPLAALDDLARQVRADGITLVSGEVLIDARLYDPASGTGSGPDAISPIMVNDNLLDVTITPGAKAGDPAVVTVRPETAVVQVDADVTTGGPTLLRLEAPAKGRYSVRGSIPAKSKPLVRILPVDDPTTFARGLFIEALRRAGVRVNAPMHAAPTVPLPETGADLPTVAKYTSPPLGELVKVVLKVSHNLYAGALPCLVAAHRGKRTLADGLREEAKILKDLGVDPKGISLGSGAGGAWADCVTPKATVTLLRAMRQRADWPVFRSALPGLGIDGTTAEAVGPDSPAKGKAFGKTGTLVYGNGLTGGTLLRSKALAGVLTTKGGRELVYAMMVNDVPLPAGVPTSREGKVLGKLCEIVVEHGP
jgi:D-alanyl-D-alanine carboxypeptidase/D-alanyl-D-alanine-endopeptidase (penicillin-binding protein 4)